MLNSHDTGQGFCDPGEKQPSHSYPSLTSLSHLLPANPLMHLQPEKFTLFTRVPPFRQ